MTNPTTQLDLPGVPQAKHGREVPPEMGVDGSDGVDRTDVGSPRKRTGRKPNASFAELGLISLTALTLAKPASRASGANSPTGEPGAGNGPVRFGGRGSVQSALPTPMCDGDTDETNR